jgi:glycosyltransferase involved in cell wall biosynthesis
MPVYRLAAPIAANLEQVVTALASIDGLEVIVVDDGSDDGSRAAAERAAASLRGVLVTGYAVNAGKGQAIRTGFEASHGDTVVFLDGDLDLPPEQIPELLRIHKDRGVDALVGAKRRAMRAGGYPRMRRVLSRLFSLAVKIAFRLPVSETQTGLKVFRRQALEHTLPGLQVTRYAYDIELLAKMHRLGYTIAEAPVTVRSAASASNVSAGTLWEMARDTAAVWFRIHLGRRTDRAAKH